jgi:hypothetical protein
MTIDEFNNLLERVIVELPAMNEDSMLIAASDAIAIIDRRITATGKDAKGQAFKPYSDQYEKKKIALGRYKGHTDFRLTDRMMTNVAVRDKKSANGKTVLVIGTQGEGVKPPEVKKKEEKNEEKKSGKKEKFKPFSGKDKKVPTNREKMEYNVKERGPILELSKTEIEDSKEDHAERIVSQIKQTLNL